MSGIIEIATKQEAIRVLCGEIISKRLEAMFEEMRIQRCTEVEKYRHIPCVEPYKRKKNKWDEHVCKICNRDKRRCTDLKKREFEEK